MCVFLCTFVPKKDSRMKSRNWIWSCLATSLLLAACSGKSAVNAPSAAAIHQESATADPRFSADTAYQYVSDQCAFGPRVPGTPSQRRCADWLVAQLRRHGAKVSVQETEAVAYDGTRLPVHNILGSYNTEAKMRVLLLSHWDSRHVADNDPESSQRHQPVMGANDGASGVGVLLELARQCHRKLPQVGIDILLVDAEDYGAPDDWKGTHDEKWWAMGTQLWCREAARQGYRATYGILLDMVGSADATFYREYYSERYASAYVSEIWSVASKLGYGSLFIDERGGGVTDDHVFVNRMLNLPCVDIIDYRMGQEDTGFCPEWHTTHDTMDKISKETLQKVGNVLIQLLW